MNRLQTNVDYNLSYLKKGEYKLEGGGAINLLKFVEFVTCIKRMSQIKCIFKSLNNI